MVHVNYLGLARYMINSLFLKGFVGWLKRGHILELHSLSCQPILSVPQLDNLVDGVSDCSIIFDHDRLHRFDQTTLNVT